MTARATRHLSVTRRYDDRRTDTSGKGLSALEREGPWQEGQSSFQHRSRHRAWQIQREAGEPGSYQEGPREGGGEIHQRQAAWRHTKIREIGCLKVAARRPRARSRSYGHLLWE